MLDKCRGWLRIPAFCPPPVSRSASSRRGLLEEGRALGRYLNGQFPGHSGLSRYVRAFEREAPAAGRDLELAPFYLGWPAALRLIDPNFPLCRLPPDRRDELARRLEAMAALSESNPLTAPKYHAREPAFLPLVVLAMSLRIIVEAFLQGVALVMPTRRRLSKKADGAPGTFPFTGDDDRAL